MTDISWYVPNRTPRQHQLAALEEGAEREYYGLLHEPGCGKSKVLIDNICILREKYGLKRALIFAPKGCYSEWSRKHVPENMPARHLKTTLTYLWDGGNSKADQRKLESFMNSHDKYMQILVMNTEAIAVSIRARALVDQFIELGDCLLAVDESSGFKNRDAQRTKLMINKLAHRFKWRRIATGTPMTRSPIDLWSQFEILKPGCLGFKNFHSFRARYAVLEKKFFGGREIQIEVGYRNLEELAAKVAKHASIIRKKDALDLPEKIYAEREVELTDEQRRIYQDLKDFSTSLVSGDDYVTATVVLAQILRLQQVVCGFVKDEAGTIHQIPTKRIDAMMEELDELDGRTIIWSRFRDNIPPIVAKLRKEGYNVVEYHGGVSNQECMDAIYRFQGELLIEKNGEIIGTKTCPPEERADIFVATQSKGSRGITLTAASNVIYFSNSYDLDQRIQSEDRAHRIGQMRNVRYVDLVARGTIEEKITEVLRNKQQLADIVMSGPDKIRELFES